MTVLLFQSVKLTRMKCAMYLEFQQIVLPTDVNVT